MIDVKNIKVYNIARAVYSARNAMNSWGKSDSDIDNDIIGENDMILAKKLIKGGSPHRKFLRQIFVTMDITAPLYWWKEFDTYKVGTTANSCSTMHTLHKRDLTVDDFSCEHIECEDMAYNAFQNIIDIINALRKNFMLTKDKEVWYAIIQLLPSSFNQKRTVTMDYETVLNILQWRSNHKLDEWKELCHVFRTKLLYMEEFECAMKVQ